jgi:hypothetical protein
MHRGAPGTTRSAECVTAGRKASPHVGKGLAVSRAGIGKSVAYRAPGGGHKEACETMPVTVQALKTTTLYSEELGIDLGSREDSDYFKWFLASLLFGGHISETIAAHTYEAFRRHRLLRPQRILRADWSYLVNPIMREGGYVRYDGRKSTQILRDCDKLVADYRGSLSQLHDRARDPGDLEDRLRDFYGVGPVTTNIFLRELRPYWRKADPDPLPVVDELASAFGIDLGAFGRKTLTFARIEAGLIRHKHQHGKGDCMAGCG